MHSSCLGLWSNTPWAIFRRTPRPSGHTAEMEGEPGWRGGRVTAGSPRGPVGASLCPSPSSQQLPSVAFSPHCPQPPAPGPKGTLRVTSRPWRAAGLWRESETGPDGPEWHCVVCAVSLLTSRTDSDARGREQFQEFRSGLRASLLAHTRGPPFASVTNKLLT